MRLWEIIRDIDEGKIKEGDKFKGIDIQFDLIVEYDGSDLVYNTIFGDTILRNSVTLCSGELSTEFIKIDAN